MIRQDVKFYANARKPVLLAYRRPIMTAFMLASDFACLFASIWSALIVWQRLEPNFGLSDYASQVLPVAACFMLVYFLLELYPGIGVGPVEELRRLTIGSSVMMAGLIALGFYLANVTWSRPVLALSWVFILGSLPLSRRLFRRLAVALGLWGLPVVVIGDTETATAIYDKLRRRPLTGLWPVLCVSLDSIPAICSDPPSRSTEPWDPEILLPKIKIAVVASGERSFAIARKMLADNSFGFHRIIVILGEEQVGPIWLTSLDLAEHLGLEVVHNLLNPTQRAIKRLLELVLILLACPLLIVFFAVIAILIRLDSPGPVLYSQKRIGYDGKPIRIWKFRSMASNAEHTLRAYLAGDRSLQTEWAENFKLRNDPRVTRLGSFLRRTSLDELPQIWNILRGEMSLIGPRPIVEEELALYGEEFQIYKQVLPGLTGMWQISGRNDLPYRERVSLDVYYVQNWSIWLDIHILMHTLLVVLQARGAY